MQFVKYRKSFFLVLMTLFTIFTVGSFFTAKDSYARYRHHGDWQMSYEYKVIDATASEDTLNNYGKDGWELTLFYPTGSSTVSTGTSTASNGYFILKKKSIEKKSDSNTSTQMEMETEVNN